MTFACAPRAADRTPVVLAALVAALCVLAIVGLGAGAMRVAPGDVLATLVGDGTRAHETLVFHLRLPRVAIAAVAGAGLALSGVVLQAVARNALADPGLLGINAGAGLATAVFVGSLSVQTDRAAFPNSAPHIASLPLVALFGGAAAAALVYTLAYRGGVTPWRLVLVGIAVGQGLSAVTMVVLTRLTTADVAYAKIWMTGSLWGTNWRFVLAVAPWVLVGAALVFARARALDVLALGDEAATGVGVAVERERRILLALAVALAASCVAVVGTIGFLGLFSPHIARRLVGAAHRRVVPVAALVGSVTLCAADLIGHTALAPHEVPAGVVVAVVGTPLFVVLLARTRRLA